jgi:hypothetical protein
MKTLIVYPHGLGDCILATPAIETYKTQTGNFVGFAMLERFKSAQLFANNPYIDEIVYTKDAWNDFPTFGQGLEAVKAFCSQYAKEHKYDEVVLINHSKGGSKITDCFIALKITQPKAPSGVLTKVHLSVKDYEWANKTRNNELLFGFVHSKTGVPNKDLPDGYGKKWIKKHFVNIPVIEVGVDYDEYSIPITHGFALLEQAQVICVTDSVYYHAAGALGKKIDLAYFARGVGVYNRVSPLVLRPQANQNIVYKLEKL